MVAKFNFIMSIARAVGTSSALKTGAHPAASLWGDRPALRPLLPASAAESGNAQFDQTMMSTTQTSPFAMLAGQMGDRDSSLSLSAAIQNASGSAAATNHQDAMSNSLTIKPEAHRSHDSMSTASGAASQIGGPVQSDFGSSSPSRSPAAGPDAVQLMRLLASTAANNATSGLWSTAGAHSDQSKSNLYMQQQQQLLIQQLLQQQPAHQLQQQQQQQSDHIPPHLREASSLLSRMSAISGPNSNETAVLGGFQAGRQLASALYAQQSAFPTGMGSFPPNHVDSGARKLPGITSCSDLVSQLRGSGARVGGGANAAAAEAMKRKFEGPQTGPQRMPTAPHQFQQQHFLAAAQRFGQPMQQQQQSARPRMTGLYDPPMAMQASPQAGLQQAMTGATSATVSGASMQPGFVLQNPFIQFQQQQQQQQHRTNHSPLPAAATLAAAAAASAGGPDAAQRMSSADGDNGQQPEKCSTSAKKHDLEISRLLLALRNGHP